MSNYGEIFSADIPGLKEKKPRKDSGLPVKAKRAYTSRAKPAAVTPVPAAECKPVLIAKQKAGAPPTEMDILTEILGEYNAGIYQQAAVVVELLVMIPEDRRRRAAELIMKVQQGALKFF